MTHKNNLFDIQQKYGDVVKMEEVLTYLDSLPDDLYANLVPPASEPAVINGR